MALANTFLYGESATSSAGTTPPVSQGLRQRLVSRHLTEDTVQVVVAAAVADLHDVHLRPDDERDGQRRRHSLTFGVPGRLGAHGCVRLERCRPQRVQELLFRAPAL